MKGRRKHRFLCALLSILMIVSLLPTAALAAEVETSTWEKVDLADITADDVVAITMTKGEVTYVLPAEKNTSKTPTAAIGSVSDGTLALEGAEADFGWTITKNEGKDTYSIINQTGDSLYVINSNSGVRVGATVAEWKLDQGFLTAQDTQGNTRYMGVYATNPDWRCYKTIDNNIKDETLGFWKYTGSETPEPTTEPTEEPVEKIMLAKLDAAPADGDTVVIYHPGSEMVLTATVSGSKLAGTKATFAEDQIEQTDAMAMLKVSETDGVYVFELDGKYLTSGETGNSLAFAEDAESDLAKWTLEQQDDGTWYIKNVGANYNGNHNQALEYYSGFTTYGVKDNNAAYKFEFYAEAPNTDPVSGLKTGDTVAIFNDGNGKAMTATASGSRLAATDAALDADGKLSGENIALFTVTVNDDGAVSFVNDGKFLTSGATGSSLTLAEAESEYSLWAIEDGGDGLFFVKNVNAKYNNNPQYLEYYNTFTTYGKSATAAAKAYAMSFREVAEAVEDPVPATPTAAPAAGEVAANTEVTFSCATEGAVISYSTDNGETWTEGTTYTVTEAVTLLVKATKDGVDSEVATFAYTIKDDTPEPTYNTIAEALAGAEGTAFTVKGVVTMVDGKNVYVQDETGGICLYLKTADSSIQLGDTVIGSGAKKVYRGLPELDAATVEKSSGMTLKAKQTTIGALTTADVCTYVQLKDLEVTEVYDNNGAYSAPNITLKDKDGATIQIYKAVVGKDADGAWAIKVGDTVDVYAAVGINNTTLQLRNTIVAEITPAVEAKIGLVTDLSELTDGAYVVIYHPDSGLAMTSETYNNWYLMPSAATIEDGKAVNPAANQVWKVSVGEDGSYTFTQDSYTVAAWISGNYVELTNNASYNADTASGWKLDVCNPETSTFYMSSSTLSTSYGKAYVEVFGKKVNNVEGTKVFCGYSTGTDKLTEAAYGLQLYLVAEPETPASEGNLVTNLDDMVGKTVAIYSPGHQTAISSKPNGDWYLKAQNATVENGEVVNFTSDFVWTVTKNDDGTYSFVSYDDPTKIIGVWPSGNYAEVTVNPRDDAATAWTLTPAKTENCFYMNSPTVSGTSGPAYIEAYVRNEFEVFSGYFTKPTSNKFMESEFALQFYLVDPADAVAAMDDGEWDGVLTKGEQYVIYNADAKSSIGLFDEANFSMKAIPTTITGDKAQPGNGAYVFTVDTMGRYYTFKTGDQFLATNNDEELFLLEPNADGSAPETAKWFLKQKEGGYILYNKEASYNGTPVCIEYFSSVFSGWTFSTKNPVEIYLFNFYKVANGTKVFNDIVQDPTVKFDGENIRYIEQDYAVEATLDDLAPDITSAKFTYTVGSKTGEITQVSGNDRTYSLTIPAADLDSEAGQTSFTVKAEITNSYGITYTGEKTVTIVDEPFFSNLTPRPNSQTGENKQPVISVKIGNVGEDPTFTMQVNGKAVDAQFADGVLAYTPDADMADGRVTVDVSVKRADGVTAEKSWSFVVGSSAFQHYFGQLHSHTTYSDGSGTLDAALEYVAGLPKSANVQFVAFTDHSNYFDTTSAANPEDALNDKSLMTDASREKWETYKNTVAAFNDGHDDILAIAGFEMTWSGGPGHINTFDSDGLVSRNNAALNNKSGDAGMKLYYATINKGDSLNQFNHPGATFGNFTDFSYCDPETDQHMFLVEVGNGEGQIGAGGYYPSYEQYTMALDKGWHVAPTNNQDNHKGRWGNANDARDVVLATDLSEESIYDAIRNYRVYATEDKNLDVNYTVNGEPMGTIFAEAPEKLEVVVNVFDPDAHESVVKVELIVNSGKVAYTWDNAAEIAAGELTATLDPSYSYYYVRVTQADGDLAVTAPVWVGDSISVGIQDVTSQTEQPIVNDPIKLQTTLFNNESSDVKVKSLVYTVDGDKVIGTDSKGYTIPANGTVDVPFEFTTDVAKRMTIKVTAVIEVNGGDLTYTKDITISVRESAGDLPVTDIKDVQAQTEAGHEYAIEGVVTSNASGYDKDTAFFDCIYVQDETAGICCFPVSGEYKIGDKVHIEGYTDFYQGEAELQVEKIEVIGSGSVAPKETTAAAVNDGSVLGSLITVKGTVESFEVVNGLVQTIMVKDAKGDVVRVFIDGYITTANEVKDLENGCDITVTGLASYDDTFNAPEGPFPRIRIRDRADVVCTPKQEIPPCDGGDTCPSKIFKDVDQTLWYHEAVDYAIVNKLFNGTGPDTFEPDSAMTRGMLVTVLHRMEGSPAPKAAAKFTDLKQDWYKDAVAWASENGIVNGMGNNLFAPDQEVTREQAMTMLMRYAAYKGMDVSKRADLSVFKDGAAVSSWAIDAVRWAVAEELIKGMPDGTFQPQGMCTRAQVATILMRFLEG